MYIVVGQSLSLVQLFATPWTAAHQASLSFTISGVFSPCRVVSCPLSQWCYLTFSSSAALFSFWLQSFPASGSFPMSRLFASGGQRIGVSVSVLLMNIHGWLPLGLTALISLQSKELSRVIGLWAVALVITESFQTRGRGSPVSGDSQAFHGPRATGHDQGNMCPWWHLFVKQM